MAAAVIVEALLVMPRWVDVATLEQGNAFVGPLAEIAYGDIILVTGVHDDSNFSAMYAALFMFLVLAYPSEKWFGRRGDGVVMGLLVIQLTLSLSKSGLLALLVAILLAYLFFRVARLWRNVRPAVAAGLVAFLSVSSVLLILDATDGHHDIAHGLRRRGGQVLDEAENLGGLATGGAVNADSRAAVWRRYTEEFLENPLTGTGFGPPVEGDTYAHNAALEAAAGAGVMGLAGWSMMWAAAALALWRLVRGRAEILPLVGAFGVAAMMSLFLSTNYEPSIALVFALVLTPHPPPVVEP
jgi:O-antigen ligase